MRARSVPALLLGLVLGACTGGGGSGGGPGPGPGGLFGFLTAPEAEPNDAPGTATALPADRAGAGDLGTAGDVDLWSFQATAGEVLRIELFATRLDLAAWDANDNVPEMALLDTDGASVLLVHDFDNGTVSGWDWGKHDLDFPCFRVPADGTYYLRLTQDDPAVDGGLYAFTIRTESLGPVQTEIEPEGVTGANETSAAAEPIAPGVVHGFHVDDEADYYSFTITEPTLVYLELKGYRNGAWGGGDYFDPELELYGTDGTTLLAGNDDAFYYDSALSYELLTPGNYFVNVREHAGSTGAAPYFLELQATPVGAGTETEPNDSSAQASATAYGAVRAGDVGPGDTDWYRFQAQAGDLVRVYFYTAINGERGTNDSLDIDFFRTNASSSINYDFGGELRTATLGIRDTGTNYLRVRNTVAPTPYVFRIELVRRGMLEGTDANDTVATSDPFDAGRRVSGRISSGSDEDVFRFYAQAGELVVFRCYADQGRESNGFFDLAGHGSNLEPVLTVLDDTSTTLAEAAYDGPASNVNAEAVADGLPTATLAFLAPADGTYYLEVDSQNGTGGGNHIYLIERVAR